MLIIEEINYKHLDELLLKDVNYHFPTGKTCIITGHTSSGKSLLIKICGGIIKPTTGKVLYSEKSIFTEKYERDIRRRIGFVFQEGVLISNLSIEENLLLPVLFLFPEKNSNDILLKVLELFRRLNIESSILTKRPSEVSYSNKKMINFIRAVVSDPELLIIDEPFFNLSTAHRKKIMSELLRQKDEGKTLIMTSNNSLLIKEMADEIIFLDNKTVHSSFTLEGFFASNNPYIDNFILEEIGE